MSGSEAGSAEPPDQETEAWPPSEQWIDERGHRCPAPVIALARAARTSPAGAFIVVVADDPAAEFDIPAWCRMTGHALIERRTVQPGMAFLVRISAH